MDFVRENLHLQLIRELPELAEMIPGLNRNECEIVSGAVRLRVTVSVPSWHELFDLRLP